MNHGVEERKRDLKRTRRLSTRKKRQQLAPRDWRKIKKVKRGGEGGLESISVQLVVFSFILLLKDKRQLKKSISLSFRAKARTFKCNNQNVLLPKRPQPYSIAHADLSPSSLRNSNTCHEYRSTQKSVNIGCCSEKHIMHIRKKFRDLKITKS